MVVDYNKQVSEARDAFEQDPSFSNKANFIYAESIRANIKRDICVRLKSMERQYNCKFESTVYDNAYGEILNGRTSYVQWFKDFKATLPDLYPYPY